MKHKLKGVYLSEVDIELLSYLHAAKVGTYEKIARDIYPSYSIRGVGNRLRKLEDNHLIAVEHSRLLCGGKRMVTVTKGAFTEFVQKGGEHMVELRSEAVQHDLILVDIRHRLLKSPKTVLYQTENEIQTWGSPEYRKLHSDAIVSMNFGKTTFDIPIEYEASMKKVQRYEPIIKKYYQTSQFPFVAFIASSPKILEKVKLLEKQLYNWDKPKFFYRTVTDFLADDALKIENYYGAVLTLGCDLTGA